MERIGQIKWSEVFGGVAQIAGVEEMLGIGWIEGMEGEVRLAGKGATIGERRGKDWEE